MVHVSELAHGYVKTPAEVVKEGDEVEAKVLEVNRKKKQIKLSIKALEPEIEEFKPAKKENRKGSKAAKEETSPVEVKETREPELTAMQIAWQEALSRSGAGKDIKFRKTKSNLSREQEDLLSRTLEKRLPTGG
jgi:ribosomal protein S1